MRPRSVYIAFEAFPRPKGASSHIASMIEAMAHSFGSVLLLCLGYGDMPAYQEEGAVAIRRFKAYHPNMLKRAFAFADFVRENVAQQRSAELCVYRDPWSGYPALHACPEMPSVFEVNALPSWELSYTYPGFGRNTALKAKVQDVERFCLLNSSQVLTVSSLTADALRREHSGLTDVAVVPNSANPAFFNARVQPESGKIGYFGSLHRWQGVEMAVESFAMIADLFPRSSMEIITAGNKVARKDLRRLIRKRGLAGRVELSPAVPAEQLSERVARFDFTLAPLLETRRNTVQGCCPVKIIESMAAGVPVIASDLRVNRELLKDQENGLLFTPGKRRELALSMKKLLESPALRATLAEGARREAMERFERTRIHEQLQELFRAVACRESSAAISV